MSVVAPGDEVPGHGGRVNAAEEVVAVDHAVMSPAQQGQVVDPGLAAVGPMDQMVGVAPVSRGGAARETAAAVAPPESGELPGRGQASRPAELEDFPATTKDDGDDGRVAGESTHGLRGDERAALRGAEDRGCTVRATRSA
jgi:hypothetical protein